MSEQEQREQEQRDREQQQQQEQWEQEARERQDLEDRLVALQRQQDQKQDRNRTALAAYYDDNDEVMPLSIGERNVDVFKRLAEEADDERRRRLEAETPGAMWQDDPGYPTTAPVTSGLESIIVIVVIAILVLVGALWLWPAEAQTRFTPRVITTAPQLQLYQENLAERIEQLPPDVIEASPYRHLTPAELARYQQLMTHVRRFRTERELTPYEVLGLHAATAAERRRYAELYAMWRHADNERILAFQLEWFLARKRLFPQAAFRPLARADLQPGDTLVYVQALDCQACAETLSRTLALRERHDVSLQIHLQGATEATALAWAETERLDPRHITSGQIAIHLTDDPTPLHEAALLHRYRNGQFDTLDLGAGHE